MWKFQKMVKLDGYIFSNKKKDGIFAPYICWNSRDYFEFLKDHLYYCASNTACRCYWPEITEQAAKINDIAYELFVDLFLYFRGKLGIFS